jgi:PAS domain S-box-containing protein
MPEDSGDRRKQTDTARLDAERELEARVQLRTTELAATNRQLREEIVARKHAQAALEVSRKRLHDILDSLFAFVGLYDTDGTLIEANRAPLEAANLKPEDVLGRPFWDTYWWSYSPAVQTQLKDALRRAASGEHVRYEVPIRVAEGQLITIDVAFGPLFNSEGEVIQLVGSAVDITERVEAERNFRHAETELRQARKLDTIGRLAGGSAQDFNNLLGIVIGHADRLLRHLRPEDPLHRSASTIRHAASRGTALTGQLLAFSRRQALNPAVLNLNRAVTNLEPLLPRLLGEDIHMVFTLAPDVWNIRVDREQLDQVLMNLAVNARDAMPHGGTLRIATTNTTLDRTSARDHAGAQPGDYVALTVSDSGHGMDEATAAQVFEPFFTTKDPDGGTGLGLSTVYGIVTQSGGQIEVSSEPGRGATFTSYFPRVEAAEDPAADITSPAAPAYGTETVLVVEDEDYLRRMLQDGLESLGYVVVTARNGKEALQLCHDAAFDVVVTDVVMPEMNGRELSKRLTVLYPQLKTLFISGFTDDIIGPRDASQSGPELLRKPFTVDDLARKIWEVLHAREQPSQQIEIDTRKKRIVVRPIGDITSRTIVESAADVVRHPLYDASFDGFIDLRGSRLHLSPEDIMSLVSSLDVSDQKPPTRTVVLTDSPRETALVMLFSQRFTGHAIEVFSTDEAAIAWLERAG